MAERYSQRKCSDKGEIDSTPECLEKELTLQEEKEQEEGGILLVTTLEFTPKSTSNRTTATRSKSMLEITDILEIGRDLCRIKLPSEVHNQSGCYGGYRKEILIENVTEREKDILICKKCQGIMKDACISPSGEQFCSCCENSISKGPHRAIRKTINSLKCCCPLIERGCKWLGTIEGCENHLDTCGYVHETCKLGCGVELTRDKLRIHVKEHCVQRIIQCEHCSSDVIFCNNSKHLKECPLVTVTCYLCSEEKYRKDMTQHLRDDCPEKMIDCPFVKYKCLSRMKRKYIDTHLEEKETKHLGLKLTAMEDLINKQSEIINKQNKEIKKLNVNIDKQNKEISNTSQQIELLHSITATSKIIWEIEDVRFPTNDSAISNQYGVAGYRLAFKFHHYKRIIIVFPGTAIKSVRPFIAKCHIMLHSCDTINCGIIEVKQKDVLRGCEITIASISKENVDKYSDPQFPGATKKDLTLEIFITMQ